MEIYDNKKCDKNKRRRMGGKIKKEEELSVGGGALMDDLPEECIANILSSTTPADVCRLSCVSSTFRSAAASDLVWNSFLPRHYPTILSSIGSNSTTTNNSKKNIFFHLCHHSPIFLDQSTRCVSVDKWSGKTSYMCGIRGLTYPRNADAINRVIIGDPNYRFKEVHLVREVRTMSYHCKIRRSTLSANTNYAAYLVYTAAVDYPPMIRELDKNINPRVSLVIGVDAPPAPPSSSSSSQSAQAQAQARLLKVKWGFLDPNIDSSHRIHTIDKLEYLKPFSSSIANDATTPTFCGRSHPKRRPDGWLELELGNFFLGSYHNDDHDHDIHALALHLTKGQMVHCCIAVQGIEFRPTTPDSH